MKQEENHMGHGLAALGGSQNRKVLAKRVLGNILMIAYSPSCLQDNPKATTQQDLHCSGCITIPGGVGSRAKACLVDLLTNLFALSPLLAALACVVSSCWRGFGRA